VGLFVGPPYYSQCAVFASPLSALSLLMWSCTMIVPILYRSIGLYSDDGTHLSVVEDAIRDFFYVSHVCSIAVDSTMDGSMANSTKVRFGG